MVITSRNTINSVFFLILDFISVGCLFIMVGAEFLGMIILIVYVGAVAVLFLFVVMMLNVAEQKNSWFTGKETKHIHSGLIVGNLVLLELLVVVGGWKYKDDLMCAMGSILFLGGWLPIVDIYPINLVPSPIWMILKILFLFFLFALIKAIVPRYRYDQLMRLGWKIFLPFSLIYLVLTASFLFYFNKLPEGNF